ncbi:2'-5' RNA ligase family protein [Actinokineospora guangxiensis]|uniref:2'-5' RNA ligase family protein n=1 Tax=Actinokineospora guangxiensis TaxID=1490288 RepID=A0ABW0ENT3_9PSEU
MDDHAQRAWDLLRRTHFPPERLVVGAHITLFHALPQDRADVLAAVTEVARRPPFAVRAGAYRSLGRGVAFAVESVELLEVRAELRGRWRERLTRQDAQPFRPHVTVQNKVAPAVARATLDALRGQPAPPDATAVGIAVWRYAGGPWEHVATVPFAGG